MTSVIFSSTDPRACAGYIFMILRQPCPGSRLEGPSPHFARYAPTTSSYCDRAQPDSRAACLSVIAFALAQTHYPSATSRLQSVSAGSRSMAIQCSAAALQCMTLNMRDSSAAPGNVITGFSFWGWRFRKIPETSRSNTRGDSSYRLAASFFSVTHEHTVMSRVDAHDTPLGLSYDTSLTTATLTPASRQTRSARPESM